MGLLQIPKGTKAGCIMSMKVLTNVGCLFFKKSHFLSFVTCLSFSEEDAWVFVIDSRMEKQGKRSKEISFIQKRRQN